MNGGQRTLRANSRAAQPTAAAASTAMMTKPCQTAGAPRSPRNSARVPSTAHENGFQSATPCNQPGAYVSASRIPDSSSTGWATVFISGASAALAPLMNTVAQPVLLLSGILLALTYAPGWLQGVADWNPFSWAVDGTRALFRGDLGAPAVWQGLVIMAVLAAAAVGWAAREFARSVR